MLEKERKKVQPTALEGAAEGEVFEPAVGTGYEVEVRLRGIHRRWLEWYRVD